MNLTSKFLAFTLLGAEWVLWVLVGLSVISVAIMIERGWFFATHRLDFAALSHELDQLLGRHEIAAARTRLRDTDTVEGRIIAFGLGEVERGIDAVQEALSEAKAHERQKLERNLAFLGTLGSNAPFIGLFGTVLGIIKAFHDLAANQAGGVTVVMAGISESLVATAIGLVVAIPAVVAFNIFNRRVRATLVKSDELAHGLLRQLKGDNEDHVSLAVARAKRAEVR